jgi:hypothetical protein
MAEKVPAPTIRHNPIRWVPAGLYPSQTSSYLIMLHGKGAGDKGGSYRYRRENHLGEL